MTEQKVVRPASSEPRLSKYLHTKGIALGLPVNGTFELTARCNFNCRMCYVHKNEPGLIEKELTADQWLQLAREAREHGLMFLLLTGGEPFIRSDFPYLYTELVKMGLLVSINTNASLYNDELRELFRRYPPTRINVTLYGGSEETYRNLCGNASYEKVVNNLRLMKQDGHQVRLNVSLTPYNVCDMEKIDAISREIGLQAKAASYMYPPVRNGAQAGYNPGRFTAVEAGRVMAAWNALRDTDEMLQRRAEQIRSRQNAGISDICPDDASETAQEGVRCRAGRCSFWMTWDGRMLPCGTMDAESQYPLRDGFMEAWEATRAYTAAIRLPHECTVCPSRDDCAVCASACKSETGRFDGKPEYICAMMRSAREEILRIADHRKKPEEQGNPV